MGKNFIAGLGAGVTEALLIVAPVETVKTKVIELNMPFLTGLKHIIKTEGFGGIYQGVSQCCDFNCVVIRPVTHSIAEFNFFLRRSPQQ